MKVRYKHIHFKEDGKASEKPFYFICNNKSLNKIGSIYYYSTWRKYVFQGFTGCVFDESCLLDIIDFMKQLK